MERFRLEEFTGGWFVGDFSPSILESTEVEVGVKRFYKGDREPEHYQRTCQEITAVVSGDCRIGEVQLSSGEILLIDPLEPADFEALSDVTLVVVKVPSMPSDKVIGHP